LGERFFRGRRRPKKGDVRENGRKEGFWGRLVLKGAFGLGIGKLDVGTTMAGPGAKIRKKKKRGPPLEAVGGGKQRLNTKLGTLGGGKLQIPGWGGGAKNKFGTGGEI